MDATPTTIGDLIASAQRQIRRAVREANPAIPPHAQRALRTISREPIRPARLAERLNITPRAVTSVLDSLSVEGLISMSDDPTDRRAKIAEATPAGQKALAEADRTKSAVMSEMVSKLTPNEARELTRLLDKLTHNGQSGD